MTTDDCCTSCFDAVVARPALIHARAWQYAQAGALQWLTSGRPSIAACGRVFI